MQNLSNLSRVSIQGVKSLLGDRVVFPNWAPGTLTVGALKQRFICHLSVSLVPNVGKMMRFPQSDLTRWILTLNLAIDLFKLKGFSLVFAIYLFSKFS